MAAAVADGALVDIFTTSSGRAAEARFSSSGRADASALALRRRGRRRPECHVQHDHERDADYRLPNPAVLKPLEHAFDPSKFASPAKAGLYGQRETSSE